MLVKWILSLRRVVKPSEVHVVRRAKKTEIYGDIQRLNAVQADGEVAPTTIANDVAGNSYYAIPSWMPIWGVEVQVLPLANFSVDLDNYEAYDKDRLPFMVDVTAFFRIADYRQAASRIESNKTLTEHLKKIVQSAVRSILASDTLDEIMGQRSVYGDKFTTEVKNNLREWGIVPVKSIELMDVRDKSGEKVIDNIMKKRKSFIERESRIEVAKNSQAAREEEIKAEQAVALKEQEKEQIVGERTAEREKAVGIAREKAQQEIQSQAKETKTREMEVIQVGTLRQAEIDKEKLVIDSNAKKEAGKIDAETKVLIAEQGKVAAGHDAEAQLIKTTKDAEGQLIVAQNQAKGIEAKGLADALAKEKFGQAEVAPQITLAKEIGENEGYQHYLIEIKQVEASQAVGIEQAKNLGNAQIKIVANAGESIQGGVSSVMDLFTAKGGQSLGSMLEAFAGTEQGQQLLSKLFGSKETPKSDKK
jgi:flotillin